jgi:hypothetical protein
MPSSVSAKEASGYLVEPDAESAMRTRSVDPVLRYDDFFTLKRRLPIGAVADNHVHMESTTKRIYNNLEGSG